MDIIFIFILLELALVETIALIILSVIHIKRKNKWKNAPHKNKKEVSKNNFEKTIKIIAILIPIIILTYILFLNLLIANNINYFYDIGSEENYLSPKQRISQKFNDSNGNYVNLTNQLVYFNANIPRGADIIKIKIKIKDNFPENSVISLGGKDKKEWHHNYNPLYHPSLEKLKEYPCSGKEIKICKMNQELETINSIEKIPSNSMIGTNLNLETPLKDQSFELNNLEINTKLRGAHEFYIYLENSLNLEVKKQDINWYNGTDKLTIILEDLNGTVIGNISIKDDGITSKSPEAKRLTQIGHLNILNLKKGVYKLKFSNFDGLITGISMNTNKIVTNTLFLADNEIYNVKNEETEIFTKSFKSEDISIKTWHSEGFQNISLNNKKIYFNEKHEDVKIELDKGENNLKFPKNDIMITSKRGISFSRESYFEPFEYSVSGIPENIEEMDYIITNYKPIKRKGDWIITETFFDLKDLYIEDGKLSLLLNTPHLGQDNNETNLRHIAIDWIDIEIQKHGII